jgi:hypothetical protein
VSMAIDNKPIAGHAMPSSRCHHLTV